MFHSYQEAYERIACDGFDGHSVRSPEDVCEICVRESFMGNVVHHVFLFRNSLYSIERLYQIQHPRMVAQFDKVCDVKADEVGFWLSKAWLRGDSRLNIKSALPDAAASTRLETPET